MPPKKKEPLTDEEKYQAALLSELDLARLQRKYILLERDRRQFTEGLGGKLEKQRRVLEIFEKEHDNILNDLMVATAPAKKKEDQKVAEYLTNLLEEYNDFSEKVRIKQMHIREIEGQIKIMTKQVQELQAQQVTDRQHEDRIKNAMNVVEALENKLEVQMKKFGSICSNNRISREQIDHHIFERQNFMKIWDKLIINLNVGKKFMLDLIEQATIAYDQREEWCSKLQALRVRAHNDLIHNTMEMREYKRKIDNSKKLEEFFGTKGQKRVMWELQEKERLKREHHRDRTEDQLIKYRNMMKEIIEFASEDDVGLIVKNYIRQEEENFTKFKYVNDLIKAMEAIGDSLGSLHLQINEQKAITNARAEQQSDRLVDLEEKLQDTKYAMEKSKRELDEVDHSLKTMFSGINQLLKICNCEIDPLLQLLGTMNSITNYNVLLYLQLLEKKVQYLLLTVYHRDKILYDKKKIKGEQRVIKEEKVKPTLYLIEQVAEKNPCPLCVEHEQVCDVIDIRQKVLSRDEVKVKLEQRLELPDGLDRIHNVSDCHLPKSREIIQKRYQ